MRKGILWSAAAALPDLALALFFLFNLMAPDFFGSGVVVYLMLLVYIEFFVIFSAGFLGTMLASNLRRGYKAAAFAVMSTGYTGLVLLIGSHFDQLWPVWAFLGLTLNRLFGIYVNSEPEDRSVYARDGWMVCIAIYFICAAIAAGTSAQWKVFPTGSIPGISAADENRHWFLDPDKVILFGFIYFTSVTAFGLGRNYFWSWPSGSGADYVE